MHIYDIPLVPGPTAVPTAVLAAYQTDYGSADLEPEYLRLYADTQALLQQILNTRNQMAIMSGEGMVALWGALKSTLEPDDKVLALATGVFGYGIADMARSVGADVTVVDFEYNQAVNDLDRVERAIRKVGPKMVTLVHCETPSGILNPIEAVGRLVRQYDVPLFYVDAVASMGGAPVNVDARHIDLCLGASQKVFSTPPDLGIVAVSDAAWQVIDRVNYQGYDALKPFRTAIADAYFPYTPNWQAAAALYTSCSLLLDEGLPQAFARHAAVADECRQSIQAMGLSLFPEAIETSAPTVTAVNVPEGIGWQRLDAALRRRGMVVAGSYGPLANRVFRIGHMGTQADFDLLRRGMGVLAETLEDLC